MATSLVNRDVLDSVLRQVQPSSRATLPILGSVGLRMGEHTVGGISTDLETMVEVGIAGERTVFVPHKVFTDLLRGLPWRGVCELTYEDGAPHVEVTAGAARFLLRVLPAEDFPLVAPVEELPHLERLGTVEADELGATLRNLLAFYSTDEARPVLTSVLFEPDGEVLRLVATDSYRLRAAEVRRHGAGLSDTKRLVPGHALRSWLAQGYDGPVQVWATESQTILYGDLATWRMRAIEGEYPNWRQLMPTSFEFAFTAERRELVGAARFVGAMALSGAPIRFRWLPRDADSEQATLELWAESQDVGRASYKVTCRIEHGEPVEVAANPAYFIDCLAHRALDEVRIELRDGLKPILIDGDVLLMPVRI